MNGKQAIFRGIHGSLISEKIFYCLNGRLTEWETSCLQVELNCTEFLIDFCSLYYKTIAIVNDNCK